MDHSGDGVAKLENLLEDVAGWLPMEDARFLSNCAAQANGPIVEIGSYRGRSTIAIAHGISNSNKCDRLVYAIEPHAQCVGIHGGKFGPQDRRAFFENVLRANLVENVALINLASHIAASGWQEEIGMLFIDGDHSYPAVRQDLRAWATHLIKGGLAIFDDAQREDDGPSRVIRELLNSGQFVMAEGLGRSGKLQALKKCK